VDRRAILPFYQTRRGRNVFPSAAMILTGIEDGHLTLNYFRWQWYQGREPFLELAYWIGPNPGVTPTLTEETNLNLRRYRTQQTGTQQDRWVMMHFHFDITRHNLFVQDPNSGNVSCTKQYSNKKN
jgi:hypothetical protein